jgi:hypothetical protein
MADKENFFAIVRVKIRRATMQDFNNDENPSGISTGMRFYLGNPSDGWRAYRINESTKKHKLQGHIDRGLVWVPCGGFESQIQLIETQDEENTKAQTA